MRNFGWKFIVTEMVFYHSVYSALFKKQVLLHADWMIILVLTFYKLRKGVKFLLNEHSHFHATAFLQDFFIQFCTFVVQFWTWICRENIWLKIKNTINPSEFIFIHFTPRRKGELIWDGGNVFFPLDVNKPTRLTS